MENKFIKYFLYGTAAFVLSELGLQYFLMWQKRFADLREAYINIGIVDVIWINEYSSDCTVKSPKGSKHDDKKCLNKFCYPRNMGKIVALIDNAQHSIDLSMYVFTSFELSQALHRALKRGLDIRIISDHEMVYSSGSQLTNLTKAGIPVRFPIKTTMLMHHKFCIIDGLIRSRELSTKRNKPLKPAPPILFTGSLNWTHAGFNTNWENMIITSNRNLVRNFEEEFERMWIAFKTFDG